MKASKTYTFEEFNNLRYVTDGALVAEKTLIYFDSSKNYCAESSWYAVYDTPNGKYITVEVWDTDGIKQTVVFKMNHIHHCFRVAPNKPKRITRWFNVMDVDSGPNFSSGGYETETRAKVFSSDAGQQFSVTVEQNADGVWVLAADQTPESSKTKKSETQTGNSTVVTKDSLTFATGVRKIIF